MTVQFVEIAGQKMALLPEPEYRRLAEAAEENADVGAAIAAERRHADGEEYVPESLMERLVSGEPPLRVWREYRELSQVQLATMIGISEPELSAIERGDTEMSAALWRRSAHALGVDLDDLIPPAG